MIVVEHEKIELDYCLSCSGVWFDTGELELLMKTMQLEGNSLSLDNILTSHEAKSLEKKRKCPICGKKMKKAIVGQEPEVLIDVCPKEDGLWFDGGELDQLINQSVELTGVKSASQERILTFLKVTFKQYLKRLKKLQ